MASEKNTCAHPGCTCPPAKNSKYCGTYCEGAKGQDRADLRMRTPGLQAGSGEGQWTGWLEIVWAPFASEVRSEHKIVTRVKLSATPPGRKSLDVCSLFPL